MFSGSLTTHDSGTIFSPDIVTIVADDYEAIPAERVADFAREGDPCADRSDPFPSCLT
ncbi:MAG: hypothetical protein BWY93_00236 [Euryarchaeota archaeon ADurb.BinA087]|nr:MAG: hypothetical protein BWY93_00236 [Euryarchaeota archaeon ADurb.BinA087]HQA81424.1 hypothetical protein [Methanoregulaceae archaeon]